MYALEAAVELLLRAFDGRFAQPGNPWIVHDTPKDSYWLDSHQIKAHTGALASGERRILAVVEALAGEQPLPDLAGVAGLDRHHQALLLAAIAHAGGSHEHADWRRGDDGYATVVQLGSLYPWPPVETAGAVR